MLMKDWIKSNHINHIKDLLCNLRSGNPHSYTWELAHNLVNLSSLILILRGPYLDLFFFKEECLMETMCLSAAFSQTYSRRKRTFKFLSKGVKNHAVCFQEASTNSHLWRDHLPHLSLLPTDSKQTETQREGLTTHGGVFFSFPTGQLMPPHQCHGYSPFPSLHR